MANPNDPSHNTARVPLSSSEFIRGLPMVKQFVVELAWLLGSVAALGVLGLGITAYFRDRIAYPLLAAPMGGLLLWTTTTVAFYAVFHLPVRTALAGGAVFCLALSAATVAATSFVPSRRELTGFALAAALASAALTWLTCAATIVNGGASVLYAEGTDHLGYANVADWIRDQSPSTRTFMGAEPRADPTVPYQSMPNYMLLSEPRFGAFAFLAIISAVRGMPATFAYDPACGILLVAGMLGVAALFARDVLSFGLLAAGLAAAHGYDFTRTGFLGKALCYPSTLFLVGLMLARRGTAGLWGLLLICVVAAGSALMLSGYVTVLIVGLLAAAWIALDAARTRRVDMDEIAVLGIVAVVAFATSGFFVRPPYWGQHGILASFATLTRSLDIESWANMPVPNPARIWVSILVAGITPLVLGALAVARANAAAAALLWSPCLLLAGLLLADQRAIALQLTGFFFPAMMCGAALLHSQLSASGNRRAAALACAAGMVALIATRVTRAIDVAAHFTGTDVIRERSISLTEVDAIARVATGRGMLVDLGAGPQLPIVALVELGRRNLDLQWTAESWFTVVGGWRGWRVPTYAQPAVLRLIAADRAGDGPLLRTAHFAIVPATAP
jgi:hypothetical protein